MAHNYLRYAIVYPHLQYLFNHSVYDTFFMQDYCVFPLEIGIVTISLIY